MSYLQAVTYLNSFVNYEQKHSYSYHQSFKLERMKGFLRLLGNPQESLRCLHIAGTKGKGSACIFLAYILKEAEFRVGLYTSPHLEDLRERIRVLQGANDVRHKALADARQSGVAGEGRPPKQRGGRETRDEFEGMISKEEITRIVERVKPVIEKYQRVNKHGNLTFFEVYTALAFLYFKEQRVDYAVLETGLGGRLDATNTVNPLVCGITPISYDHMQYLGNTLKKIAREKAGIIKSPQSTVHSPQLIVISAAQQKEARDIIKKRCLTEKAKLYEVGKDIVWRAGAAKGGWQDFAAQGLKRKYTDLKIKLLGSHQLDNAALAVGMAEALEDRRISPKAIKSGLMSARWPGRLERVERNPTIVLDGAQNAASALALKETIKKYYAYQKLILVLGISADKDIQGICKELESIADRIILSKADNVRAEEPENIQKFITKPSEVTCNVKEAIALSKRIAGPKDLILITGSLFVVGEARKVLKTLNPKF